MASVCLYVVVCVFLCISVREFVCVMQIHPEDAFGQQMMRNLEVQQGLQTFVTANGSK